jgi:hypothetical protein
MPAPPLMNFLWPEMLWSLLAVPLLVLLYVWLMRRRKKTSLRYASLSLVREAYTFSTSAWASFKAFGATGLMLVFMIAQGFYLSRHLKPVAEPVDTPPGRLGPASRPAPEK